MLCVALEPDRGNQVVIEVPPSTETTTVIVFARREQAKRAHVGVIAPRECPIRRETISPEEARKDVKRLREAL